MGKQFHKNSLYILILRSSILLADLIGVNIIFEVLMFIFELNYQSNNILFTPFGIHFVISITWIIPSLYFKTYEGNLKIAYNLRSSFYQLFVQFAFLLFLSYYLKLSLLDYSILTTYYVFSLMLLPLSRYGIAYYLNKIDNVFPIRSRAIIIGSNPLVGKVQGFLENEHSGFRLLKLNLNKLNDESNFDYLARVIQKSEEQNIKYIYTFINLESKEDFNKILNLAERKFIRLRFIKGYVNSQLDIKTESDIPLEANSKVPLEDLDNRIRKRFFDIFISTLVIVFILSWLWPIIALLIKLDSKGPVIFKQRRTGKNNKPFVCFKFRTMQVNEFSDTLQAQPDDYRLSRVGRLLRKSNLDELPQFINVLIGDMSIIGPRPHMLNHSNEYENLVNSYTSRHLIKPGISGWAQVNGLRGNLDLRMMEARVHYDLDYIRNWSFWIDLDIFIKTIVLTLTGDDNAY